MQNDIVIYTVIRNNVPRR